MNQKRKCLFLNREIKKGSNSIVEEDFFMKNYKKNDKLILSLIRYRKESQLLLL